MQSTTEMDLARPAKTSTLLFQMSVSLARTKVTVRPAVHSGLAPPATTQWCSQATPVKLQRDGGIQSLWVPEISQSLEIHEDSAVLET